MVNKKEEKEKKDVKPEKSLRDKILQSDDIETDIVTVKEWGNVKIKVASLNVKERGKVREAARTSVNPDGTLAVFDADELEVAAVVAGAKDPKTNQPIFKKEDAVLLLKKNAGVVDQVATRILELSGMTPEAGELRKRRFRGE